MNAIEFVKKYGLQEAIKVVDLYPVSTLINIDGSCVSVLDLKKIADAFDLVERFGGISLAKDKINGKTDFNLTAMEGYLKQAINLVEQCNDR